MNRTKIIKVGDVKIGGGNPFALIAGPCVIEDKKKTIALAGAIQKICKKQKIPFIFKASYDKANRTSIKSFRGLGIDRGLSVLKEIKEKFGVPVLSDIHSVKDVEKAKEVLDILQIPAFLCRQTDLLIAAGKTKKVVNVKKGQFLAPHDMRNVVKKMESTGNKRIMLTERGVSFGYNTLVSDFRSLEIMSKFGYPVVFDATHSVQQPGGMGDVTGGNSEYIPLLARCSMAAGCDAIFMEVHPNPSKALSDGPNSLKLNQLEKLLVDLKAIDKIVKKKK